MLILVSMCHYLHKSRTGFKGTNTMINLLITYAIKTCLVTTVFSVICLVTFITLPDSLIYQPCYFIGSKLHASSLLSILNARKSIRGKGQRQECKTISSPMFTTIIDDGVFVTESMERQLSIEGDGLMHGSLADVNDGIAELPL
ncbi:hypothetical protein PILCRDRAFT_491534 [Piloderma croceum F 1598]|uniref:DUF6534 domain-containing protein n=1 Tax=Piloderma croceum (strain F 1598) TaxID=765440 RepID=A0A0C3FAY9_PILCF|nr:hypothetical protein PILCRDRAFT_491534 [Piloderma croceum F 1598]